MTYYNAGVFDKNINDSLLIIYVLELLHVLACNMDSAYSLKEKVDEIYFVVASLSVLYCIVVLRPR